MDEREMLNTSLASSNSRCLGCSSSGSYGNETYDCETLMSTGHVIVASVMLALITMATIVGNLLVMASVFIERSLRTAANLLIVSLAAADLLVALLVMPLSAVNQIEGCWILGPEACSVWIFFDVLCCTSSIYHLVAIAFDRFWAVSRSDYIHNRSSRRILAMIGLGWALSAVIGAPPLLGWTSPHGSDLDLTGQCLISQDLAYTIFSTVGAFYLPLVTIVVVYAKVYRKAKDRILRRHFKAAGESLRSAARSSISCCSARNTTATDADRHPLPMERMGSKVVTSEAVPLSTCRREPSGRLGADGTLRTPEPEKRMATGASNCQVLPLSTSLREPSERHGADIGTLRTPELDKRLATAAGSYQVLPESPAVASYSTLSAQRGSTIIIGGGSSMDLSETTEAVGSAAETLRTSSGRSHGVVSSVSPGTRERTFKRKVEQKRERKAARTLTIVTGTFVCCWLPFFIVATLRPVCGQRCQFPHLLTSVILWLGYVNSLLNPMIYTLFNPDFRNAFRKILLGKYRC